MDLKQTSGVLVWYYTSCCLVLHHFGQVWLCIIITQILPIFVGYLLEYPQSFQNLPESLYVVVKVLLQRVFWGKFLKGSEYWATLGIFVVFSYYFYVDVYTFKLTYFEELCILRWSNHFMHYRYRRRYIQIHTARFFGSHKWTMAVHFCPSERPFAKDAE